MILIFKTFLKIIFKVLFLCFAIPIAIVLLPFYLISAIFDRKQPIKKSQKKHWVDLLEEIDALFF